MKFKLLNNLGYIYYNSKNLPKAIECFEQALESTKDERFTDIDAKVYLLNQLGNLYYKKNNLLKAIEYFILASESTSDINLKNAILKHIRKLKFK